MRGTKDWGETRVGEMVQGWWGAPHSSRSAICPGSVHRSFWSRIESARLSLVEPVRGREGSRVRGVGAVSSRGVATSGSRRGVAIGVAVGVAGMLEGGLT